MPQAIALAVFKGLVGFALSRIGQSLMGEERRPDGQEAPQLGFQANSRSSKKPLPLIYGTTRVGCNFWYIGISGEDNKYLHLVCTLGEGELDSIAQVGGVDQVFLDNKLYTEYGGKVYYEFFNGSATQNVCATLNSAIPEWTDPLRYTAYLYLRLEFDRDYFQGVPNVTVTLNGLKCPDPKAGTTAWSDKPALCVNEYLTRPSVRGGFGVAASRVSAATIETARAYCVSKGWTCNMPLTEKNPVADNMELLLANFRGELIFSRSEFSLRYRDLNDEAVVMTFSDVDGDLVEGSFSTGQPDIFSMPNAVRVVYLDEEGSDDGTSTYKEKSFPLSYGPVIESDGDYVERTYKCLGLSDLDLVQQMAYYFYERVRANKPFSFQAGQDAAQLEPMDLIQLTHTLPGWTNKVGRVETVSLNEDNTVSISCIEEFSAFYDTVFDPASQSWYGTTLPSISDEPYPIVNVSHSEEVYTVRGRSFTRWKILFDPPDPSDDPFFDSAEVYLKVGSDDYKYMTNSQSGYLVDPVEEGQIYFVKFRTINIFGTRQPDSNATVISTTITGKDTTPTNLTNMTAAANGDSVSIFSDPVLDPDIDGYEVRLGDAWDGGVFVSYNKNCSLRLNGVRPGTHTFWMSPKDNARNYSGTPVYATVTVFRPPGYTQLPTYGAWSWDFTTGVFSNTEYTTIGGSGALKCSHTGDVLTGTWMSPTYDMGAVEMVRLWGDFLTVFLSSATSWAGVAPVGTSWAGLGGGSWNEIFRPTEAGRVDAVLYFSTDGSNWHTVSYFQILCAEVTARYIKVELTLTDPTIDANQHVKELNMVAYEGPQL